MLFWIITLGLAVLVAALLAIALLRGKPGDVSPAAYDLEVYRTQLKEVERDAARGVIGPDEAERLKAEVGRRILAADTAMKTESETGGQPRGATALMAVIVIAILAGGGLYTYWRLGAPGYGDLALKDRIAMAEERRATRPSQAEGEAAAPPIPEMPRADSQFTELVGKLRAAVAQRPDDLQGQALLVRNEAVLGNFTQAYAAQKRVIEIKGDEADATDYADLADMLILAAGGYVSPEAEEALRGALSRDRQNGTALYYWGLMLTQNDRPDQAFNIWNNLLRKGPADAPWIAPIRAQITQVAKAAGVDFTMPEAAAPALRGPSAEDMANAAEMTDEDRQAMIRGMVEQLSERLASEGGTAAEWSRLISAYGVLGEKDRAREIWTEAQGRFADRPDDLATVRQGAQAAGVAE